MLTVDLSALKARIKEILIGLINQDREVAIAPESIEADTALTNNPAVPLNSLVAIRLFVEIEKEFGVKIPDESLTTQNFKNIEVIASFVNKLMFTPVDDHQ